jgi:predicted dehydrogenase
MAFDHALHRIVIAEFIDAIGERRDAPVAAREALALHRLIDAVLESSRQGRGVHVGAG